MKYLYSSKFLTIVDDSLLTHGCGALYSVLFKFSKPRFGIRFHCGGYGNVKAPSGCWTIFPKITHYHRVATHFYLFNFGFSIVYNPF